MPNKKYLINLSDEESQTLTDLTRKGEIKARKFKRAMISCSKPMMASATRKSWQLSTLAALAWNGYVNALSRAGWNEP